MSERGAALWDNLISSKIENNQYYLSESHDLLNRSVELLTMYLEKYDVINILDVGIRNAYRIRALLARLMSKDYQLNYSEANPVYKQNIIQEFV